MELDIGTLSLMVTLSFILQSVMLVTFTVLANEYRGISRAAAGNLIYGLGYSMAWLHGRLPNEAILAGGDFMASGAIAALLDAGLAIPGDVSVMSMDGFNLAEIHDIPLTAVHVPRDELGVEALRLLQQRIASPGALFRHLLLGGRLCIGNSVKRPAGRKVRTPGGRNHGLYGNLAS